MVSCSSTGQYGNSGCDGGLAELAFLYTDSQPLMSSESYPYVDGITGITTTQCNYDASQGLVSANGFSYVPFNHPKQLQAAVNLGPVVAAIDGGSLLF
jgi:hypothetical protein